MPKGAYERRPAEERFWKFVNKETGTDCWEFTSHLDKNNYGIIVVNRKNMRAHRFSYQLHKGDIPKGMVVMHSCDNPKCVQPDHLSIGTHFDNTRDMINKNRQNRAKGSSVKTSKLTEDQVIEIKNKLHLGIKQEVIAKYYNVSQSSISAIKNDKTWAHLNI